MNKVYPEGYCATCEFHTTDEEEIPMCDCPLSNRYKDNVPADCTCNSWKREQPRLSKKMKVIDLLIECRNGTKVEIDKYSFSADGDSISTVFEGTVGEFGKTRFEQYDIDYLSVRGNAILIVISER